MPSAMEKYTERTIRTRIDTEVSYSIDFSEMKGQLMITAEILVLVKIGNSNTKKRVGNYELIQNLL